MYKDIKDGIGLAIGLSLGFAIMGFVKESIMEWGAKDEDFMAWEKENNPKLYKELNKYR